MCGKKALQYADYLWVRQKVSAVSVGSENNPPGCRDEQGEIEEKEGGQLGRGRPVHAQTPCTAATYLTLSSLATFYNLLHFTIK